MVRRRDLGLGGLSLVSLAEAREEAMRLRKMARAGRDPLAERRKEQAVIPTFKTAAEAVHKTHAPTFRNEKHAKQWIVSLEKFVFPTIGNMRVDQITSRKF